MTDVGPSRSRTVPTTACGCDRLSTDAGLLRVRADLLRSALATVLVTTMLAALLATASLPAHAHLLNMTRATLGLAPGGAATIEFEIDLTRAYPDRAAYHAASTLTDPTTDAGVQALVARMLDAMIVETPIGRFETTWTLTVFAPEQAPLARYEDPFHWPMTRIRASADSPLATEALQVHFDGRFPFEEPVALTIEHGVDDVRMTRWLVIDQRSPTFTLESGAIASAGAAPPILGDGGVSAAYADTARADAGTGLAPLTAAGIGFSHILPLGLDHVLFVMLLVLLCARLRPTLLAVTLFTIAHALTFTAVLLRWVPAPPAWIEVAIAASILWLAVDVLRGAHWGPLHGGLTLAFGLVHGLGFASALGAQTLPTDALAWTLVALNAGVEGAQLLVAAVALVTLTAMRRTTWAAQAQRGAAALSGLLATFWMLTRL